jgi:hypothetical protein
MQALLGIAGALVGGLLVLLGDATRRRAQRRNDDVLRLAEAATAYAVVVGRLVAEARANLERGEAPVHQRAERYEASVRFFMTPGSEELYPAAMRVMKAYTTYALLRPPDTGRGAEIENYFITQRDFESLVRAVVRRGHIGKPIATQRIRIANK